MRLFSKDTAPVYCGFEDEDDKDYFWSLHKEGRGPSYVKPSDRRVYFTKDALDDWMASWKVVSR